MRTSYSRLGDIFGFASLVMPSDTLAGMLPLPSMPMPSGPSDGVNHRRHMRLVILGRDGDRKVATYVPKGKQWPQPGRPLGVQEAARRRRQLAAAAIKQAQRVERVERVERVVVSSYRGAV